MLHYSIFNGHYIIRSCRNMILSHCFLVWGKEYHFLNYGIHSAIEIFQQGGERKSGGRMWILCLWRKSFKSFTSLCPLHFRKSWHKTEQKYKDNRRNHLVITQIRLLRKIKITSYFCALYHVIALSLQNIFIFFCIIVNKT